jgi:hypothetical protein
VENTLVKNGKFRLPGKKALYGEETKIEVVLADVTENPIERPKKTRKDTTAKKKKHHTKKPPVNC